MPESVVPTFTRDATGLVRSISGFDAFVYNFFWLNIGLGIEATFILAPYLYPGGNILLATAVATAFCAVHVAVWALLAGAMPRSGGDYVFLSRMVNPVLGFVNNWVVTILNIFVIVLAAYLFVSDGISAGLAILSATTGSASLASLSTVVLQPVNEFIIGAIAIIVLTVIMIFWGNGYFQLQRVLLGVGLLGLILAAALLLMNSHASLVSHLDSLYGANATQRTIQAAVKAGEPQSSGSAWTFFGAIAVALFTMPWSFASAWIGGEVRHPERSQMLAMVLSVVIGGVLIIGLGWLLIDRVGSDLLSASGYLFFTAGNSPITAPPYYHFFAGILTGNSIIAGLIVVGFIAWTFMWIPINLLSGSRNIFSWAFDRVIPSKLSSVSERTHTPALAIAIVGGCATLFWGIYAFTGAYFLTSFTAPSLVAILILDLGAIYGAYRRPDFLRRAPGALKKYAGLPLLVIFALISAGFFAVMEYWMLLDPVYGANTPPALITWGALVVTGLAVFAIARSFHRRYHGYDLLKAYAVLPPD